MTEKHRAGLRGVVLTLIISAALGTYAPAASTNSPVRITAFVCSKDRDEAPKVVLSRDSDIKSSHPVPAVVVESTDGAWAIKASVPLGHWYVIVHTKHCAAYFPTTSIQGEGRAFLTGLYPENEGAIEPSLHYVAGRLPVAGTVDDLYISRDGSPNGSVEPVREGRYFYFDSMSPGDFVLTTRIGDYTLATPLHVSPDRPGSGLVVDITSTDIWRSINCPVLEHCTGGSVAPGP